MALRASITVLADPTSTMALRLDPYSLQLFVAAAEEGSIARAAAREHIAPSALSRRLGELEAVFGTPLFIRSAHGITLTEAGHAACKGARRLQSSLDGLLRDVQAASGTISGHLRLFANASSVVGFLPERLKAFAAACPGVTVELQERQSAEVVRACLADVADVGVAIVDDLPGGLQAWPFAADPLLVVLPAGHELAAKAALRFADVLRHPLVCVQTGGSLDRLLRDRAAANRLELTVAVTVNSFDSVCRMVEAGLGIAIVTRSAAAAYAGSTRFERRPLDEAWVERTLKVVALRKTPRPAAVAALIRGLVDSDAIGDSKIGDRTIGDGAADPVTTRS